MCYWSCESFRNKNYSCKPLYYLHDHLKKQLNTLYNTSTPTFKTLGDNLRLNINLKPTQKSNELLKLLNNNGEVIHFKEVIPSASEIFINSVKNN